MGYVGTVTGCCLADMGHSVCGLDKDQTKVELLAKGLSPIVEDRVPEMLAVQVSSGRFRATVDVREGMHDADISLVCVGTPSQENGSLSLTAIKDVCRQIGNCLPHSEKRHTVIFRSTVLPGTMRSVVLPLLEEASGLQAGKDFGLAFNPEFLREGSSIYDYYHPAKIIVGSIDDVSADVVAGLYRGINAPIVRCSIDTAEMVKYTDNVWHAMKVCFANEIGSIAKHFKLDGREIMDIFCRDEKLNISSSYLRPGLPYGGSCLPKDTRALLYAAHEAGLQVPLLGSLPGSNTAHLHRAMHIIESCGERNLGFLGLSFKAGTDDLRESPLVQLVEHCLGKGYDIRIFDPSLQMSRLMGANAASVQHLMPHLSSLLVDRQEAVLEHAGALVIGYASKEFDGILENAGNRKIIDFALAGTLPEREVEGVCW